MFPGEHGQELGRLRQETVWTILMPFGKTKSKGLPTTYANGFAEIILFQTMGRDSLVTIKSI